MKYNSKYQIISKDKNAHIWRISTEVKINALLQARDRFTHISLYYQHKVGFSQPQTLVFRYDAIYTMNICI
jgi:hypothetical protein